MGKWLGLLVVSAAACVAASTRPPAAPGVRSPGPEYDEKGNLKRPADFRAWVFVGTTVGR